MLNKVKEAIRQYQLLDKGDKVVIGVSGGPDSITLLYLLKMLQSEFDLILHVAHFNHMFRGQEADEEAEFVREVAARLGLPCTVKAQDVPRFVAENNLSPQEGARILRYRFFYDLAAQLKASKIALGHHADDQAETVLLHLFRGSGTAGLAGMSPKRGKVIRPLLGITRQQIEDYCREQGLPTRTDPSNFKSIYTRNKIRLELLPLLKKDYNPNVVENLNRTAEILRVENEFLEKITEEVFLRIGRSTACEVVLEKSGFGELHPALQRRLIRFSFKRLAGEEKSLNYSYVRAAQTYLSTERGGKKLGLPEGIVLKTGKETIIFSKPQVVPDSPGYKITLDLPGTARLPGGLVLTAEEVEPAFARQNYRQAKNWEAYLDLGRIKLPLTVRPRKPGDIFRPLGLGGSKKKLKDFLIDLKVPQAGRNLVPVVTDATGQIIWVGGYRIDENYKLREQTKRVAYLRLSYTE